MKNIILTLLSILFLTSCMAQIIPVEQEKHYIDVNNDDDDNNDLELEDGAYFKDINGVFTEFIGTWIGNFNGNTFKIVVTKVLNDAIIKADKLHLKYEITDSNGNILDSTINNSSSNVKFTATILYPNLEVYHFYYSGEESVCGQSGSINIRVNNDDPNKLHFNYRQLNSDLFSTENCPNGVVEQILPIETTILTKQ